MDASDSHDVFVVKRADAMGDLFGVVSTGISLVVSTFLPWMGIDGELGRRWLVQVRDSGSGEVVTARFAATHWGARRQARKVLRIIATGGAGVVVNFGGVDYS